MDSRKSACAGIVALVALAVPSYAQAETFTVTSSNSAGPGSLREAINQANASSDGSSRIEFDLPLGRIGLDGSPLPTLELPVTIEGPEGDPVEIDGQGADWMLRVGNNDLSLSNVSITGFEALQTEGGIIINSNAADLALQNVEMFDNQAQTTQGFLPGGLISANRGQIRISDSVFDDNSAAVAGYEDVHGYGAVLSANTASVSIVDSTFTGNSLSGGVLSPDPDLRTILRGGVISSRGDVESAEFGDQFLRIRGSNFSGNRISSISGTPDDVEAYGVAVSANGIEAENSTFFANITQSDLSTGGAIYAWKVDEIRHVTFAANIAATGGHLTALDDEATVEANVFATKAGSSTGTGTCSVLPSVTRQFNVSDDPSCASSEDQLVSNTGLGVYGTHGGSTEMFRLRPKSAAVDVAPSQLLTDQRGAERPVDLLTDNLGGPADAGAYELQSLERTCLHALETRPVLQGSGIFGTPGEDVLVGDERSQSIRSLEDDDRVCSLEGDDYIVTGPGNDHAKGGPGADALRGGSGNDVLDGGPGDDICVGGRGEDVFLSCEERR
jgi:hypothetical protein